MKTEYEKIYDRYYDSPINKDGSEKEANLLGEFQILEILEDDMYSSIKIGVLKDTDKIYIINESEVSGFNGGSKIVIYECESIMFRNQNK